MIDPEFMKRCSAPEFQKTVKEHYKESRFRQDKWKRDNPELYRLRKRKYHHTEKGQISAKKRNAGRHKRYREEFDKLGDHDKHLIRQFYVNCPDGHHVDHIHPLCKGGRHHISNLQYLSAQENWSKGGKILYDRDPLPCPECLEKMIYLSDITCYCEQCRKAFKVEYEIAPINHQAIDENSWKE